MMKKHAFRFVALVALIVSTTFAQQPAPAVAKQSPEDRIALYQALLDLTNPWTVMCIAAHPDDEDGTSLIVMRRKYGAHTVSLFSTFGEGGQNAIGPELYEELGAIRARETMAAAEIQGSEPHFLGLKDFGFSKSADEAFRVWGHDEALRRMVLQIRKLRPDVIITNHSATNNDHGHHQATARLELEAFDDAADPTKFPEQLKDGLTVWQVQRLFVRARGAAVQNPDRQGGGEQLVTIDPNEQDPIRGTTFAEQALSALQKHATQGPWPKTVAQMASRFTNSPDGRLPIIRYRLLREAKGADALTKDSHNFLDGLRLPEQVAKQLAPPTIGDRPAIAFIKDRKLLFHQLLSYRTNIHNSYLDYHQQAVREAIADERKSNETSRFLLVIQRLERSLALAAGIDFKVVPSIVVTPSSTATLSFTIWNRGSQSF
ncbi:MAG TPA: PIG-L family deacetylase, partial [Pyrinomonadaceae bacterium]|nr:PIG-L family deacetylase [Pyrinomonadaceae bacterium]